MVKIHPSPEIGDPMKGSLKFKSLEDLTTFLRLFTDAQSGQFQAIINRLQNLENDIMAFKEQIKTELEGQKADLLALDSRVDATAAILEKKIKDLTDGLSTSVVLTQAEADEILALVKNNRTITGTIEAGVNSDGTVPPTPTDPGGEVPPPPPPPPAE